MQVKPKEVSADKATTPGQRERFEAAYVTEYNQLRNAKYTAEHIARMRVGEGYGERAFLNGWWKGWQAAEAQFPAIPAQWSKSLGHCWPVDQGDEDGDWYVGTVDEDGKRYEVIKVEASQYDAPGEAKKIAVALIQLWVFAAIAGGAV